MPALNLDEQAKINQSYLCFWHSPKTKSQGAFQRSLACNSTAAACDRSICNETIGAFRKSVKHTLRHSNEEFRMEYETKYEASNRVTWISKPEPFGTREHIVALGGVMPNGLPWGHTLDEVVALIDRGASFHVQHGTVRVALETYWHGWRKYLRTKADGIFYDNLLALPNIA